MLLTSLRRGFARIGSFSGRDSRAVFWPYLGFVVLLVFAGMAAVMVPAVTGSFSRIERFAAEHPDQVTVHRTPTSVSYRIDGNHPELMPDVGGLMVAAGAVFAAAVVLIASAVARRLHDSGLPGYLGLLPLPFIAFSLWGFGRISSSFAASATSEILPIFFAVFLSNLLYLVSLGILAMLLMRRGTVGPNRYGEAPST